MRHRRGRDTEAGRRLNKLIGKTTWFKNQNHNQDEDQQPGAPNNPGVGAMGPTGRKKHQKEQQLRQNIQPSAVLFVPWTHKGSLSTLLKEKEAEINNISRRRVKVI